MKIKIFLAFIAIYLVSFSEALAGENFFVDNSCNINGNGLGQTCATYSGGSGPFNSLANAQLGVVGDQSDNSLLLKKGQTFNGQFTVGAFGTVGHPFTISSYGTGPKPIITGGQANILIDCWGCQYIVVDGLEFSSSTGSNSSNVFINYPAHHITVKNCYSHHSPSRGIIIFNSSDNIIDSNEVSYNGKPGVNAIEIAKAPPSYAQPTTGNVISNNRSHHNMGYGITVYSPYFTNLDGSTTKIYGNESYNNSAGIYLVCADGIELYNNNLHDNGKDCQGINDCPGEDYGFAIQSGSNNSFHDNIISGSHNTAIGIYGDNGVTSGPSNGNKVYRNVIYNTIKGAWVKDIAWQAYVGQSVGSNNKIFNNIVLGSGTNLDISDDNPTTSGNMAYNNIFYGGSAGVKIGGHIGDGAWTLKNNIMAGNSNYALDANILTGSLNLLNNLYYKPSGGILAAYRGTNYTSANITSIDANAKTADPKFVGTSVWSDLRLQSGSPAINTGINLGTEYKDALDGSNTTWPINIADQNNFGSGWELGAFVFTSGIPQTTTPPSTYGSLDPIGTFDGADCNTFYGWAGDQDNPNLPVGIHFYANGQYGSGGTFVGSTMANLSREVAVCQVLGGTNCGSDSDTNTASWSQRLHGFSFTTPASLKDNLPHAIYAYGLNLPGTGGDNILLRWGNPKTITCPPGVSASPTPVPTSLPDGSLWESLLTTPGAYNINYDLWPVGSPDPVPVINESDYVQWLNLGGHF